VKNRDQELKPKREDMLELDDTEEEEDGGRNEEKPEGNKKAKERIKLEAEATNLGKNIEDMVKSKEVYMEKALQTKVLLADKKNAINQARWEAIREDDKRKHALEERRIDREEKKAMMDLIANENKTMIMDPSTMDAFTREWWDMRREEIMERRRLARLQSHANGAGAWVAPVEVIWWVAPVEVAPAVPSTLAMLDLRDSCSMDFFLCQI
jgi:hypothetical protein